MDTFDEEMDELVALLNSKRSEGVPEVQNEHNRVRMQGGASALKARHSKHVGKFEDCGQECLRLTERYYGDDFQLLQYPTLQQS